MSKNIITLTHAGNGGKLYFVTDLIAAWWPSGDEGGSNVVAGAQTLGVKESPEWIHRLLFDDYEHDQIAVEE